MVRRLARSHQGLSTSAQAEALATVFMSHQAAALGPLLQEFEQVNQDTAIAALVFLSRVQLQGNEAPALMHVVSVLEGYANPAPPNPMPEPEPVREAEAVAEARPATKRK